MLVPNIIGSRAWIWNVDLRVTSYSYPEDSFKEVVEIVANFNNYLDDSNNILTQTIQHNL